MPENESAWEVALEDIKEKRKSFYHSPLPRKKQTHTVYRGRACKPKVYTKQEILIFQLNQLCSIFE